jgi:thymidine kinase
MCGGKTGALLEDYRRHTLAGDACMLIKHDSDSRFSNENVHTHDGQKAQAHQATTLDSVLTLMRRHKFVYIDEIQFFPDVHLLEDLVHHGIIVTCAGLLTQFTGVVFPVMHKNISIWDNIKFFNGVCFRCKSLYASRTVRRTPVKEGESMVGGTETYMPVCHACHLKWLALNVSLNLESE